MAGGLFHSVSPSATPVIWRKAGLRAFEWLTYRRDSRLSRLYLGVTDTVTAPRLPMLAHSGCIAVHNSITVTKATLA